MHSIQLDAKIEWFELKPKTSTLCAYERTVVQQSAIANNLTLWYLLNKQFTSSSNKWKKSSLKVNFCLSQIVCLNFYFAQERTFMQRSANESNILTSYYFLTNERWVNQLWLIKRLVSRILICTGPLLYESILSTK